MELQIGRGTVCSHRIAGPVEGSGDIILERPDIQIIVFPVELRELHRRIEREILVAFHNLYGAECRIAFIRHHLIFAVIDIHHVIPSPDDTLVVLEHGLGLIFRIGTSDRQSDGIARRA